MRASEMWGTDGVANGAYEEFVHPVTGHSVRIPIALLARDSPTTVIQTTSQNTLGPRKLVLPTSTTEQPANMLQCLLDKIMPCLSGFKAPPPPEPDPACEYCVDENDQVANLDQVTMGKPEDIQQVVVSSKLLENLSTDLKPGTVGLWAKCVFPQVTKDATEFAKWIDVSEEKYMEQLEVNSVLRSQDKDMSTILMSMLNKDSEHVEAFKEDLTEQLPDALTSGYKMWHAIKSSEEVGSGVYRRVRITQFWQKDHFNLNMSVEQMLAAAKKMRKEYHLLPADVRSTPHAEEKMLLDKMPAALNDVVATYKKKLQKREDLGQPLKWTYEDLAMHIAIDTHAGLIDGSIRQESSIRFGKTGKGGVKLCVNCGSTEHVVTDKKCTKTCDECGSKICPKVRGYECVVTADKMPLNKEVLNAKNPPHPVPPHVYQWLVDLRKEKRAPDGTVKAAKINAATATEGEASDTDDDESGAGARIRSFTSAPTFAQPFTSSFTQPFNRQQWEAERRAALVR